MANSGSVRQTLTLIVVVLIQIHIIMMLLPKIKLSLTFPIKTFGRIINALAQPVKFFTGVGVNSLINHDS